MADVPEENLPQPDAGGDSAETGQTPAPDDLDALLSEYTSAVPDPAPSASEPNAATGHREVTELAPEQTVDQSLDALLRSTADAQRIEQLTGQIDSMRAEAQRQKDVADFEEYASSLQSKFGDHLPPDFVRTHLLAQSATTPELEFAWRNRNADRAQINNELTRVELVLQQLQRDPNADQQKIAQLNEYGYRLGVAYNAREIIRKAERAVEKSAREYWAPDPDLTADRNMVAAAVRDGGSGHRIPPAPPPDYGSMSDQEFREHLRQLKIGGF